MTKQTPHSRPFGVTVIIILQLISFISLVGYLLGLPLDSYLNIFPSRWLMDGQIALAVGIPIVIFQMVILIGFWRLQRWAWFVVMIQLGLGMAISLLAYVNGFRLYIYMLLNVIMVFYLNQHEVQHVFGQKPKPQQETA